MSVVRIIGERQSAEELEQQLRNQEVEIEILSPGTQSSSAADLEIAVEQCPANEALSKAMVIVEQNSDACLLVSPDVFVPATNTKPDSTSTAVSSIAIAPVVIQQEGPSETAQITNLNLPSHDQLPDLPETTSQQLVSDTENSEEPFVTELTSRPDQTPTPELAGLDSGLPFTQGLVPTFLVQDTEAPPHVSAEELVHHDAIDSSATKQGENRIVDSVASPQAALSDPVMQVLSGPAASNSAAIHPTQFEAPVTSPPNLEYVSDWPIWQLAQEAAAPEYFLEQEVPKLSRRYPTLLSNARQLISRADRALRIPFGDRHFLTVATATATIATIALLFTATFHRFSPLPVRLSNGSSSASQPVPFHKIQAAAKSTNRSRLAPSEPFSDSTGVPTPQVHTGLTRVLKNSRDLPRAASNEAGLIAKDTVIRYGSKSDNRHIFSEPVHSGVKYYSDLGPTTR